MDINFDAIFEPALRGVARGYVFAGFAINAANDPRLTEFHPRRKVAIRFVSDATPELLAEHKQQFSIWAMGNGFRDAMEAFGITLDRLYEACDAANEFAQGREGRADPKMSEKFHYLGLLNKVRALREQFHLQTKVPDDFDSLNRARNCLSHRRGMVGEQDCNENGRLVLRFLTMELFFVTPDGRELRADEDALSLGLVVDAGSTGQARIVEHRVPFPVGSVLVLEPVNVDGLFFTLMNAVESLKGGFIKFIEDLKAKAAARGNE